MSTLAFSLYALVSTQAVVVAATLAVPVLAPEVARAAGVDPALIGWHTSAVFASAFVCAQFSPQLVARLGGIRVSQVTTILAALAMVASAGLGVVGLAIGTVLLGAAYAQSNTASGVVLNGLVGPKNRNFVFSLKQTSVPIGGAAAGLLLPVAMAAFGWRGALVGAAIVAIAVTLSVGTRRASGRREAARGSGILTALRASRDVRSMALVALLLAAVQFSSAALFVAFLTESHGLDLAAAGALLSLSMVFAVGARIALGAVADRVGAIVMLGAIALLIGLSAVLLATTGTTVLALSASVVLLTCGFSWNGLFLAEIAKIAPSGTVGAATAAGMSSVFLGGALAPSLASLLVESALGYPSWFAAIACAMALCLGLLLALRNNPQPCI